MVEEEKLDEEWQAEELAWGPAAVGDEEDEAGDIREAGEVVAPVELGDAGGVDDVGDAGAMPGCNIDRQAIPARVQHDLPTSSTRAPHTRSTDPTCA